MYVRLLQIKKLLIKMLCFHLIFQLVSHGTFPTNTLKNVFKNVVKFLYSAIKKNENSSNIFFRFLFLVISFSGDAKSLSAQSTSAGLVPRFLSRGHTYRAVVGDTLILPCEVENLGKCGIAF